MGKRHIEVAQNLDMDIVAICDLNQNALSSAGQTYKIPEAKQFLDINQLLEKVQLDCIVISTTAPSHCHLTLLAANAGIPYILCEKPMATSLAECDQMIAVCEKQGSRLAVNHHMRFLDRFTFILEQI